METIVPPVRGAAARAGRPPAVAGREGRPRGAPLLTLQAAPSSVRILGRPRAGPHDVGARSMGVADLKSKAREAFKRKNYEQSVEIYVEAVQFGPDDMELYEGLQQAAEKMREAKGKSFFGGGLGKLSLGAVRDPMKKLVACVRFLAKNPGDKNVLMDLGDAAEAAGHLNGAVYGFRAAAKADPDDNRAWKRLGGLLYR